MWNEAVKKVSHASSKGSVQAQSDSMKMPSACLGLCTLYRASPRLSPKDHHSHFTDEEIKAGEVKQDNVLGWKKTQGLDSYFDLEQSYLISCYQITCK